MSVPDEIAEVIKKRNLQEFSKGVEELKSKNLLTDDTKDKINQLIDENFPISLIPVAKSLLGEDEEDQDEKEREEKHSLMAPKNICSEDTQDDLIGSKMSASMEHVITFLLPKNKKSECITEQDLAAIVGKRGDEIFIFDSSKNQVASSSLVYRLPTSGIWVVGHPMYFRIFKAYQLESFGKHIISVETHKIGSVWRQEHELYLAKPLHWVDFIAFIQDNVSIPNLPSACACSFKPEEDDWSVTAKISFPVKECHWMIPTWNGIPIFLSGTCGKLLNWSSDLLIIPTPISKSEKIFGELKKLNLELVSEVDNFLVDLRNLSDANKLYIETDKNKRIPIKSLEYFFSWSDTSLKPTSDIKRMEKISSRLQKWPSKFKIEIAVNNLKDRPIKIVSDTSTLIDIGYCIISRGHIQLYWSLEITQELPSKSSLNIENIRDLKSFMGDISEKMSRSGLQFKQGENVKNVVGLNSKSLLFDDETSETIRYDTSIENLIELHGPVVQMNFGVRLATFSPGNGEEAEIVGKNGETILPLTEVHITKYDRIGLATLYYDIYIAE